MKFQELYIHNERWNEDSELVLMICGEHTQDIRARDALKHYSDYYVTEFLNDVVGLAKEREEVFPGIYSYK